MAALEKTGKPALLFELLLDPTIMTIKEALQALSSHQHLILSLHLEHKFFSLTLALPNLEAYEEHLLSDNTLRQLVLMRVFMEFVLPLLADFKLESYRSFYREEFQSLRDNSKTQFSFQKKLVKLLNQQSGHSKCDPTWRSMVVQLLSLSY